LDSVLEIHGIEGVEHDHDHHDHEHDGDEPHEEEAHKEGHDHVEEGGQHHEHHHDEDRHHEDGHKDHDHEHGGEPEITALLLTTKSPIANINLPRSINRESGLQAATPALEMARLTSMLGLGSQSFAALSVLLIVISALSIFAGLAGSLENRMGDLAVLRAIGYSQRRIFKIISLEGMVIVVSGIILGLVMGVSGFMALTHLVRPLGESGAEISITPDLALIILAVLVAGLFAAILPAFRASKVDVARQLSRNG